MEETSYSDNLVVELRAENATLRKELGEAEAEIRSLEDSIADLREEVKIFQRVVDKIKELVC